MTDDTPTLVPVDSTVTPIKPPAKQIPAKIPDEDRGPLNEVWMEMLAMQNSLVALEAQIGQYKALIDHAGTRIAITKQQGMEMQRQFDATVVALKERLGIPAHWIIDTKSGAVAPPQQPQTTPQR